VKVLFVGQSRQPSCHARSHSEQIACIFTWVQPSKTSDSSHWWFTRTNQNMAAKRRLDNPVSPRRGILSCHSEWRADRMTSNIRYSCMLWPMGCQTTSETRARDHAWGFIRVARVAPRISALAPLLSFAFFLDSLEEEKKQSQFNWKVRLFWIKGLRLLLQNQLPLVDFGRLPLVCVKKYEWKLWCTLVKQSAISR